MTCDLSSIASLSFDLTSPNSWSGSIRCKISAGLCPIVSKVTGDCFTAVSGVTLAGRGFSLARSTTLSVSTLACEGPSTIFSRKNIEKTIINTTDKAFFISILNWSLCFTLIIYHLNTILTDERRENENTGLK